MTTPFDSYVTLGEAARLKHVNRVTIWRWIRDGKLPCERFGREVAIHKNDLALAKSQGRG